MNESDRGLMMQMTYATEPPTGATICTVRRELGEAWVNCAGFNRHFRDLHAAADFLGIEDWRDLETLFIAEGSPLIMIRRDGKWQSSAQV